MWCKHEFSISTVGARSYQPLSMGPIDCSPHTLFISPDRSRFRILSKYAGATFNKRRICFRTRPLDCSAAERQLCPLAALPEPLRH